MGQEEDQHNGKINFSDFTKPTCGVQTIGYNKDVSKTQTSLQKETTLVITITKKVYTNVSSSTLITASCFL